jgi:nucleoside-diphosphate-sugar epimerase
VLPLPTRLAKRLQTAMRLSGVKAEIRPAARLMRLSDEEIIFGSTEKLRKHPGWKPKRSIEQTLSSMLVDWYRGL